MAGNKSRPGRSGKKPEKPAKDPQAVKQRSTVEAEIKQSKAAKQARNKARVERHKAAGREQHRRNMAKSADRRALREIRKRLAVRDLSDEDRNSLCSEAQIIGKRLGIEDYLLCTTPIYTGPEDGIPKPPVKEERPIAFNKPMTSVELALRKKAATESKSAAGLHAALFNTNQNI